MTGGSLGRLFQLTIAGGSYQEALSAILQGVPPGIRITEQELYGDLLLRKPGADELSSPRKEPDLPLIITGQNCADTVSGADNALLTNGTPLTILIPNLDRHDIHVNQYRDTNRTPRPGHASYASFIKYGPNDDAIGAGIFSGRYTAPIVAAGQIAKTILRKHNIEIYSLVREMAGVNAKQLSHETELQAVENYKTMRRDLDPFYQQLYVAGKIKPEMRFLEKAAILAEVEKNIDNIRSQATKMTNQEIQDKYHVHPVVNCPDLKAAEKMTQAVLEIAKTGDSVGGIVEVVALGLPAGLGEPVFNKLDAEIGRLLGIGAVKGIEIGSGFQVKDLPGSVNNDAIYADTNGKICFASNHAGGVTGGLSTGQPLVIRLAVKPTPTIDRPQDTIDKYSRENRQLAAITRRDPTIVARIWPVAEAMLAVILVDALFINYGYQRLSEGGNNLI